MKREEEQNWTILKLIEWSANYLSEKGIDDARLNAELMLAHTLDLKRIDLYLKFDKILSPDELAKYKSFFNRRLKHEPVQYILGYTEFMGIRFEVNPAVLIPRPDTEVLVVSVLNHCKTSILKNISILDIGTGSGCIAISLAKMIPDSVVTAIDRSADALEVAKQNATLAGVSDRVKFVQTDFMNERFAQDKFDIIVSNPPYIPKNELETLQPEVRLFEPEYSYTDYGDGLSFYRMISKLGHTVLNNTGSIFVEVGYNQAEVVKRIFENDKYSEIESFKDYNGIKRVVKAGRS
ncbi:MAG: peptide chain release factor N(5)-glutamine methyltransferase [Ignavibacteriales bacterium]|nr:peptide chain release factor N(5)-glutamine methyltransferase [Ignavibacteriales bacterium]